MMKRDIVTMFLMETVFHEAGLAPIKTIHHDYNRILADLSPEEARIAKRKFRKLWRRTAKYLIEKKINGRYMKQTLGIGAERPTRSQKNTRKTIVLGHVLDKVVVPMRSKLCK